jgi:hypothetical protein
MKFSRRCSRDIGALFEKHTPDIVFAFGLANGSVLCALAQKHTIPSVLFIRGMELVPPEYRHIPLSPVPVIGALNHALYIRLFKATQAVFNRPAAVFQNGEQYQAYLENGPIRKNCPVRLSFAEQLKSQLLPPRASSRAASRNTYCRQPLLGRSLTLEAQPSANAF